MLVHGIVKECQEQGPDEKVKTHNAVAISYSVLRNELVVAYIVDQYSVYTGYIAYFIEV